MPFLRFSRDKRGYENTYLLHGFRSGDRARPRVLYWFRTPPNVKVGRLPLDEEAIRAIEERNPDLSFDWAKMLRVRPKTPVRAAKRSAEGRSAGARSAPERSRPRRMPPATPVDVQPDEPLDAQPHEPVDAQPDGSVDAQPVETADARPNEPDAGTVDAAGLVEGDADIDVSDDGEGEWRHPVVDLVGDEGLARLRARYAELRARLAEKQTAPDVREVLEARVEAMNPDGWRQREAVVHGIERFEANAEEIKQTLGRRPRRRRGGAGRRRRGSEAGRDESQGS